MCDTLVCVEPDRVLFAKNSDRDPNEGQLLEWHPRRVHPAGADVRCTWIAIPQARETHAVLLSRPFWMWGAEIGANEHGVTIGNEAVFTRQPYAPAGLTGMDLLRLALERACTAREAVDRIVELLDRHGQGGGCGHEDRGFTYHNSFLVADPCGAFVLETAGAHSAVEQVAPGQVRSLSNALSLPAFAREHADRLHGWGACAAARQARTAQLARAAAGPRDLMQALRDHGHDGRVAPVYSPLNGAMSAPCLHAGGLVASAQTTASWVAELRPRAQRHFVTGTAAPCTSLFKPVRVLEPLDLGAAPSDRAERASLWWRHERLHRAALRDPERLVPLLAAGRDELEARWDREAPEPRAAFEAGERWLEESLRAVEAAAGRDRRPWYVRRLWRRRDARAGLVP